MSNINGSGAYAIEDMRGDSKHTLRMIGVWLAFFIVAVVMHVGYVEAFIGASTLAMLTKASRVIDSPSPNMKWRVWGASFPVRAAAAAVFAVATFLSLNDSASSTSATLIVLGIPTVALAIYAAMAKGLIGGGGRGF